MTFLEVITAVIKGKGKVEGKTKPDKHDSVYRVSYNDGLYNNGVCTFVMWKDLVPMTSVPIEAEWGVYVS